MAHPAQIGILGCNDRHSRRGHARRLQVSLNKAETHSWPVARKKRRCLDDWRHHHCCWGLLQPAAGQEQEAAEVREATWDLLLARPRKSTEAAVVAEVVEAPP